MPENARSCSEEVIANLAKALVVVRTPFLLFGLKTLFRLGMAIHAIVLLVADTVLLYELANGHLIDVKLMQEVTFVATLACVSQPMDADLLLSLLVAYLIPMRFHVSLDLIIAHLLVDVPQNSVRLRVIVVLVELAPGGLRGWVLGDTRLEPWVSARKILSHCFPVKLTIYN